MEYPKIEKKNKLKEILEWLFWRPTWNSNEVIIYRKNTLTGKVQMTCNGIWVTLHETHWEDFE